MKRVFVFALMALLTVATGCDRERKDEPKVEPGQTEQPSTDKPKGEGEEGKPGGDEDKPSEGKPSGGDIDPELFAKADASFVTLPEGKAQRAITLLKQYKPQRALNKESLGMSEQEWGEIRDFTRKLVDPKEDKYKQFLTILGWIRDNIKYKHGENTAYATFRNRSAVCQGYSYLLKAMCHAIDVPALIATGDLHGYSAPHQRIGGHAWCYVFVEGAWYVADPTNIREAFPIHETNRYERALVIDNFEGILYEDDTFAYTYEDGMLTVHTIKATTAEPIVVPYGTHGVQVSSFNPLFASVREGVRVYLADNIRALGVEGRRPESRAGNKYLLALQPTNQYLEDYKGTVYERGKGQESQIPIYTPPTAKLYLKGEAVVGKNRLTHHDKVETIVFGEGVRRVEGDAVERCPRLKTVYLPQTATEVAPNAFSGSSFPVKVERYAPGQEP